MTHVKGLSSVQFDPLNVVGRNADLVLQSRIKNYSAKMLYDALYVDRTLIDGFDKCMCIYPIEDFPHLARIREMGYSHAYDTPELIESYAPVMDEIARRGPICSSDLAMDGKLDWTWTSTKLSRAALESLWFRGKLILSHKKGTRRYYDLIENHLPEEILMMEDPHGDDDTYFAWLLMRRIRAVGMLWNKASDAYVFMPGFTAARRMRAFQTLLDEKRILPIEVEGIGETLYIPSENEQLLHQSLDETPSGAMRFIAPLDNLIWDRKLIEALFGFHYRWEVYTPAAKREYGYYVLPVIRGNRFVARFEPENFRGGTLVIKHWWWEKGVKPNKALLSARETTMKRFMKYLGADGYQILSES